MLSNFSSDINTNIYLTAAERIGLQIDTIDTHTQLYKLSNYSKEILLYKTVLSINHSVGYAIASNKSTTGHILRTNNLPAPEQITYNMNTSFDEVSAGARTIEYPVVLKPVYGSQGKLVFPNITNEKELRSAYDAVILKRSKFILEKHHHGLDYRVIVCNGKIIDVIQRTPAYVVGDGIQTIEELVMHKNQFRQPHGMKPILLDDKAQRILSIAGMSETTIPLKDKHIQLRGSCNFSEGGETKRVDLNSIPQSTQSMLKRVTDVSNLFLCGIDLICNDITKPLTKDAAINEINSNPQLSQHYFADMVRSTHVAEEILKEAFIDIAAVTSQSLEEVLFEEVVD